MRPQITPLEGEAVAYDTGSCPSLEVALAAVRAFGPDAASDSPLLPTVDYYGVYAVTVDDAMQVRNMSGCLNVRLVWQGCP
jgi:hypothetical protein